jgi:oligopeptide/dipeptide ABC transporter ATP-binding protein
MTTALSVRDLEVSVRDHNVRRVLVETVSLDVRAGAMLGIVGETGAGKTLTVRSLVGLLPHGIHATGEMSLGGEAGIALSDLGRIAPIRGTRIGIVLQNPIAMFDPMLRLRTQLVEGVVRRRLLDRRQALDRVRALMRRLGFQNVDHVLDLYPHQLSGGMGQRLAIAMVLMPKPSVIVADEPTSALDANLRVEALRLLKEIGAEEHTSIVLVSHDLGLVSNFCDDLAVMYAGRIVEQGPAGAVLRDPQHPYTRALAACSPSLDVDARRPMPSIPGSAPTPNQWPAGCTFAPRCPLAFRRCIDERPTLRQVGARHAACHLAFGAPP